MPACKEKQAAADKVRASIIQGRRENRFQRLNTAVSRNTHTMQ